MDQPVIGDKVTVEVRNQKGEVVREYDLTKEEASAAPVLMEARQLLNEGNAIMAFEKLMECVRLTKGDKGVTEALQTAKKQYTDLCDAEDQVHDQSLLVESGQTKILQKALKDPNTSVCPSCHGILRKDRMQAHIDLWCPNKQA